jgi:hypothetical protein
VAENQGSASSTTTVHAELDRTMNFSAATAAVREDVGSINVTVTLSAARATEVSGELAVSGSATVGEDFDEPPQTVRFFPGQTTLVFPITITNDSVTEDAETVTLTLSNFNLPDVTAGGVGSMTITIASDTIFSDDFEDGDTQWWSATVGVSE